MMKMNLAPSSQPSVVVPDYQRPTLGPSHPRIPTPPLIPEAISRLTARNAHLIFAPIVSSSQNQAPNECYAAIGVRRLRKTSTPRYCMSWMWWRRYRQLCAAFEANWA
ncbi:hypothetical protein VTI74DRAFT_9653 [Chaetomium olivicolor]